MRKNRIKIIYFCCGLLALNIQVLYALNPQETKVASNGNSEKSEELYIDLLKSLLLPYISDAVIDYYSNNELGDIPSFDLFTMELLDIKRLEDLGQYYFEFVIEIHTFQGAHNPPYATDIIRFRKDFSEIHVIDYKHYPND